MYQLWNNFSIIDNINYADYLYSSLFDCISASTLSNEHEITPAVFTLYQNHPNPFNPSTNIGYQLAKNNHVKITIYNTMGKLVKILVDDFQSSGFRTIKWNGRNSNNDNVSSGIYFYSIQSGEFQATKKMILLD